MRALEDRIIQDLLAQRSAGEYMATGNRWALRLVSIASLCAGMLLLGGVLQELVWALLAAAGIWALGASGGAA
jgi:hypothetical protein